MGISQLITRVSARDEHLGQRFLQIREGGIVDLVAVQVKQLQVPLQT